MSGRAHYLLMDSWFTMTGPVTKLKKAYPRGRPRTLVSLFQAYCEVMKDLSFLMAFKPIIELTAAKLQVPGELVEEAYQALIPSIFRTGIEFFGQNRA